MSSFQTTNTETGVAIHDTIRTINQDNGACCGNEYDLNGVLVNSNISFNQIFSDLYDGTTDGQYNYAIDHNLQHGGNYSLFKFDENWNNPVNLFALENRGSGVTYDSISGSLWTTQGSTNGSANDTVRQYALDGSVIFDFSFGALNISSYGLAWDASDDTLWLSSFGDGRFHQFQKDGTFIKSTNFGRQISSAFGMEFNNNLTVIPAVPYGENRRQKKPTGEMVGE